VGVITCQMAQGGRGRFTAEKYEVGDSHGGENAIEQIRRVRPRSEEK